MLQQRLYVTIPFKDEALSLIFVHLILYRSGISRSNHLHTLRHNTLELLKLAIMNLQSGYTLDLIHFEHAREILDRSVASGMDPRSQPEIESQ